MKLSNFEDKFIPEPNTGCWIWLATLSNKGYGKFKHNGKMVGAHRVSYELYHKDFDKSLCVLHRCDNRLCVNPSHLFQGTKKDNGVDMVSKNRSTKGSKNSKAKLTEEQVIKIKQLLLSNKYTHQEIANIYNVTRTNITTINTGRNWGWLKL